MSTCGRAYRMRAARCCRTTRQFCTRRACCVVLAMMIQSCVWLSVVVRAGESLHSIFLQVVCVVRFLKNMPNAHLVGAGGATEAEEGAADVGNLGQEAAQVGDGLAGLALCCEWALGLVRVRWRRGECDCVVLACTLPRVRTCTRRSITRWRRTMASGWRKGRSIHSRRQARPGRECVWSRRAYSEKPSLERPLPEMTFGWRSSWKICRCVVVRGWME